MTCHNLTNHSECYSNKKSFDSLEFHRYWILHVYSLRKARAVYCLCSVWTKEIHTDEKVQITLHNNVDSDK